MRILIVGGFGFIGGRLAQKLTASGHDIVLGSRQDRAVPSWLMTASTRRIDWYDDASIRNSCVGVDAVVHCAGMSAGEAATNPAEALHANGVTTARLAREAQRQGVARFVFLSTTHVYGAPLVGAITEASCAANWHPYASSHRAGEDAVRCIFDGSRGQGIVLRLSNGFGTPAHADVACWSLLVPDLCRQAVTTGTLTLRTAGRDPRDFITLSDVCSGIEHVLSPRVAVPRDPVLNLGSGETMTVRSMATLVQSRARLMLAGAMELFVPSSTDEPPASFKLDISRLLQTGFAPTRDVIGEIDGLLRFCIQTFAGRSSTS